LTTRRDQNFAIHKTPAGTLAGGNSVIQDNLPEPTSANMPATRGPGYAASLKEVGDCLLSSPRDGGFRPANWAPFPTAARCRLILRHVRSPLKTCAG
jgi:hypothetical protein